LDLRDKFSETTLRLILKETHCRLNNDQIAVSLVNGFGKWIHSKRPLWKAHYEQWTIFAAGLNCVTLLHKVSAGERERARKSSRSQWELTADVSQPRG